MNARELVAWNVRRLRVARDLSSEALAADAGIDRAYVSEIERGLANPTIDMLDKSPPCLASRSVSFSSVQSRMSSRQSRCVPGVGDAKRDRHLRRVNANGLLVIGSSA